MRRITFLAVLSLLGSFTPTSVWAFDTTSAYILPQSLPPELLPPPPAEKSEAWQKQIAAVLQAQKQVSPDDITAIKDEQHVRLEMMTAPLGATFTRERLPQTFHLLDRVMASTEGVSEADKQFWHTRRPYLTDDHVHLYINRIDNSPSYPSGHTSTSRVLAEVLGMLLPEKRAELRAHAAAIAAHRVEAGAHYPNDLEGGRTVAMLVVGALTTNEDFQDDLKAAKEELGNKP